MAAVIDGNRIAQEVRAEVRAQAIDLKEKKGIIPGLAVILVGEDAASKLYVGRKEKAETGQGLLSEAEQTLTKFLKEYEDSDLANACLNELASVRLQQGQRILGRAEAEKEAARRSQGREDARRRFEAAHQDFVTVISKYRQRLSDTSPEQPEKTAPEPAKTAKTKPGLPKSPAAKKPKTKPKSAPKADEKDPKLEADLILARINLASTEFFIARTYDGGVEQEKKQRDQRLNTAIQEFDNLFQEYRGALAGFVAHLWHGRALEEQGDLRQALMIYDEIIVNEPPKGAQIPKDHTGHSTGQDG